MKPLACLLICSAGALAQNALDPAAAEWKSAAPMTLSLHRTPPLYPTDAPAALDVPSVQAQFIHSSAGNFVRLEWADKTRDADRAPEGRASLAGRTPGDAIGGHGSLLRRLCRHDSRQADYRRSESLAADGRRRASGSHLRLGFHSRRGGHGSERPGNHQTHRTVVPRAGSIRRRQMVRDHAGPRSEGGHAVRRRHLEWFATGSRRQKVLHDMVSSTVNTWAVFRFALGYPDERHLERFAELAKPSCDAEGPALALYRPV